MAIYKDGVKVASANVTGDTLPIGSIVDFDGTAVPDGWQLDTSNGLLVAEYIQSGTAANFSITGLDLVGHGGCYQIEFIGASTGIGIIGIGPNGVSNHCDFMRTDMIKSGDTAGAASIDSYYYKSSQIHIARFNGASGGTTKAICWLTQSSGAYPFFTSRSFAKGVDGVQIARNGEGWVTTNSNITSLTFYAESGVLSGCVVRIYKRQV